jgi:hypothetical protein
VKAITRKFFAAYNAHDVDGMLALCADGAQGRYLPYGKKSLVPIRGGLDKSGAACWGPCRISCRSRRDDPGQKDTSSWYRRCSVGHAGGCPWSCNEEQVRSHRHAYIIRYNADGKITRLDCYWDNTAINAIKASVL